MQTRIFLTDLGQGMYARTAVLLKKLFFDHLIC